MYDSLVMNLSNLETLVYKNYLRKIHFLRKSECNLHINDKNYFDKILCQVIQ